MGRKSKWFLAVTKVFNHEANEKRSHRNHKSKRKWKFGKRQPSRPLPFKPPETVARANAPPPPELPPPLLPTPPLPSLRQSPPPPPPPPVLPPAPPVVELKLIEKEDDRNNHAHSVALASAVAAEAAAIAAKAAAEVARLTATTRIPLKYREDIAAIKIQSAFRGYQARRALRALRGLNRLKNMVDSNAVKRQTTNTMRSMQTLARVQSQIRSRRIRMTDENQALQMQIQVKYERELENLKTGEGWDDSLQSKEQIEAKLVNKQEAAMRRERALAYAFSHQWKSPLRAATPMFIDPNNPQWGWSWLERWMASRAWESRTTTGIKNHPSIKNVGPSFGAEASKTFAHRSKNIERTSAAAQKSSRPSSRHSPSTPPPKLSPVARKNPVSPRGLRASIDDDSRSMLSSHSEQNKRNSIAGSSVRDDESLASSPSVPNYMASTESTRAKHRFQSPSNAETFEKLSVSSVKKRLSFPMTEKLSVSSMSSPATARRYSGPPKVGITSLKDVAVHVV